MIRGGLVAAALVAALPLRAQAILGDDPRACYRGSGRAAALIDLVGIKDTVGELRLEVYPAAKDDFLADFEALAARGRRYHRVRLPPPGSQARVCVEMPGPGPWAIAVIHSRGGKRSFKWRTDGIGFANNPGFGFGPPSWDKATVDFGHEPRSLRIVMKYYRALAMRPLPGVE